MKKILLDADVIIHFSKSGFGSRLYDIFSEPKCIPDVIWHEEVRGRHRDIENQVDFGLIQVLDTGALMRKRPEIFMEYARLQHKEKFGKGESVCMAVCRFSKDIIGSSNLRDIKAYCEEHMISYLITMDFLVEAQASGQLSVEECDAFIQNVLAKGSKLPRTAHKGMRGYLRRIGR